MIYPATPYLRRLTADHGWHGQLIAPPEDTVWRRDGRCADVFAELLELPQGPPR